MFSKLTSKKIIFALLLLILITAPYVHAVVLESGIPNTDLTPGKDIQGITIAQYINYIYIFVLGVVGIAVFASLVFWGVVWISSGIADKRGMALGKIKDAFTGLAIALGAYIILNTINPDLLTLKDLGKNPMATTTIRTSRIRTSSLPETKRAWYCYGAAPVGARMVDDSECQGAEPFNRYCGLNAVKACFVINVVQKIYFKSSPMAPSCTVGVQGENVTYQWAQLPLDQNGSKNCNDRLAGGGWSMVSDSFCTQPSPGVTYSCCSRCNQ